MMSAAEVIDSSSYFGGLSFQNKAGEQTVGSSRYRTSLIRDIDLNAACQMLEEGTESSGVRSSSCPSGRALRHPTPVSSCLHKEPFGAGS